MNDDGCALSAVVSSRPLRTAFSSALWSMLAFGFILGGGREAHAQQAKFDGEFSVQRFDPAPGPRNFFVTRTARSDGKFAWSGGLVFDYATNPLVVQSCVTQSDCSSPSAQLRDISVVKKLSTAHLLASFTPKPFLQLGLSLPLTYVSGEGLDRGTVSGPANGSKAFSLGDPALEGKFRFLGDVKTPLALAMGAFITVPTAQAITSNQYIGQYIGDGSVTGGLRAIGDLQLKAFSVAGNLVGVLRKSATMGDATIGNEFRYSVAVGYQLSPTFRAVLETFGNSRFSSKSNGTSAMEGLLGAQFTPLGSTFSFLGGLGLGLINGVGAPGLRAFVGVSYTHENRDKDGDGILDEQDQCPDAAEDRDGFQDSDGCPDPDNDGDGILDDNDKCPNEAEDMDGFEDLDGCPDVDNDKDGVPDDADHCPLKPETKNGFKDDDGCPDEIDSDSDGVPDSRDKCPTEAEDTDGFQDEDGCPDLDNDNDGIPDDKDECIDEPETPNGFQDEDGCPDEAPKKR
jgi:OmpA-OmpF porin, OOP family